MPVQDNEDKRVSVQSAVDAEEELRRWQAQEQQQNETSVQKSGKLLPFLNAKAEHHQDRLDNIERKIATQKGKIEKHTAMIEKLADTAERLEDRNKMLKATLGGIPIVQKYIQCNEERIADIRDNKIPKRQEKLRTCQDKVVRLVDKSHRITHKLNRVVALNDAIKSFSIGFSKSRREAFADAMDRLNEATYHCLTDRRKTLDSKKQELIKQYNDSETSITDKYKIQAKITDLSDCIQKLDERIEKVWQPDEFYTMQPDDVVDAQMYLTSEKLADMTKYGVVSVPDLAESTLFSALETEGIDKSQVAALADKFNRQQTADVEVQL